MNILFLTIGRMNDINERTLYCDLLRCFRDNGHNVYTVSPHEKRTGLNTEFIEKNGVKMLYIKTGNITKTSNLFEKGIATIMLETKFIVGVKKYLNDVKFDLVIYPTPPITLLETVKYVKKRDNAKTYLLLKDIFPQNAVDLGMIKKSGLSGLIYKYFRKKEKKLYLISDKIGCMSQANVDYILKHNKEIDGSRVEVCPNAVEPIDRSVSIEQRISIRNKYGLPLNKMIFVYGGNLGKPQGINFLIECLKSQKNNNDIFFLIVGDGSEFKTIETYVKNEKQKNLKLLNKLPKEDYDMMVGSCDVGMIFLDYRFTIPNFPSRLLSYMMANLPVLAATDPNTDVGQVIVDGGFGWWCLSNDVDAFSTLITSISKDEIITMAKKSINYLNENYSVKEVYKKIIDSVNVIQEE